MTKLRISLAVALATLAVVPLNAQKLPPTDSWPTYNGDYSGKRFSPLTKINANNVNALGLAWMYRFNAGVGANSAPRGTPLMVDGVVYISTTDNAFAIDARTGREVWHYTWPSKGARHFSNRGVGISGNWLFFETPDCNLVSLNKEDGTLRWAKSIADIDQFYYCSVAPVIVGNHVIAGVSGDDLDIAGFIDSRDPETGELQWRFYTVPQKKGDAGMETWPNEDMGSHGGGMTWQPITYDPDLDMIYVTTGNPQPVIASANRQDDNLFTASVVAVSAATGKMAWSFQSSPHDTHDWDSTQTAVLLDGVVSGQPRKLLAQATRNGKFFVLDRVTGKSIISTEFVKTNWSLGYDAKGQPIPNPAKNPSLAGTLVSPNQEAPRTRWPPTFSPNTGLFYVSARPMRFSVYYLYDGDPTIRRDGAEMTGVVSQNPCCWRSITRPAR